MQQQYRGQDWHVLLSHATCCPLLLVVEQYFGHANACRTIISDKRLLCGIDNKQDVQQRWLLFAKLHWQKVCPQVSRRLSMSQVLHSVYSEDARHDQRCCTGLQHTRQAIHGCRSESNPAQMPRWLFVMTWPGNLLGGKLCCWAPYVSLHHCVSFQLPGDCNRGNLSCSIGYSSSCWVSCCA